MSQINLFIKEREDCKAVGGARKGLSSGSELNAVVETPVREGDALAKELSFETDRIQLRNTIH